MIYILLLTLSGLLILSFWINHGDIISPSFIFCVSFLFASIWAAIYSEKWDLDLHVNTYWVITLGVLEFIIVCLCVHLAFQTLGGQRKYWSKAVIKSIDIPKSKYVFMAVVDITTILASAFFLIRSVGATNLTSAIFLYRYGDISDSVAMPRMINLMRTCVNASAYWFAYIFANNLVANKKIDKKSLAVILLAMLNTIVVGSRGNVVYVLLATIIIYIVLKSKSIDTMGKILKFKNIAITLGILAVVAFSYQSLGNLLGRGSTANTMDYLATYCGAEIKNLDIMLQQNIFKQSSNFGEQTFINLYKWIGPRFGITNTEFALTFQSVNGYNLGNVYTTFYPFIYDFGYEGVAILTFIMAFICQFLYEKIRRQKNIGLIDTKIVAYGYIFNALLFSYFSNKFFEQIFSAVFIYSIVFWIFFKIFFTRLKLIQPRQVPSISQTNNNTIGN